MRALGVIFAALAAMAAADTGDDIAKNLNVMYEVVDNYPDPPLPCKNADWGLCFKYGIFSMQRCTDNTAAVHLTYNGASDLSDANWEIYWPTIRRILEVDNPDFEVSHITGDLHVLKPTASFKGFPAGGKITLPVTVEYWSMFDTDTMPRWYVVANGGAPKLIANTDTEDIYQFMSPIGDKMQNPSDVNPRMTMENRFAYNDDNYSKLDSKAIAARIIPAPLKSTVGAGTVDVSGGLKVDAAALPADMQQALKERMSTQGVAEGGYAVSVSIKPDGVPAEAQKADGYTLDVKADGATVVGYDAGGAFYGVISLLALIPQGGQGSIPEVSFVDAPRFAYRGAMADVARNFHKLDAVKRMIDAMSMYKMNKFHWHLTNDEGWRLEIPGLPELTEIGSKRCHDLTEKTCLLTQLGSGPDISSEAQFYTVAEYQDVLKYAKARNIEVIPEFDTPGHARAAVVSMEARADSTYKLTDPEDTTQLLTVQFYDKRSLINPCLDSSWTFMKKLIAEVKKMHDDAGVPLQTYHFGGDEAKNIFSGNGYKDMPEDMRKHPFDESPACIAKEKELNITGEELMSWFAQQTAQLVKDAGIPQFQGWQDGMKHGEGKDYPSSTKPYVNVWEALFWGGSEVVDKFSDNGFNIILSMPDYLYLDFPNEFNYQERGYYWASRSQTIRRQFFFSPENIAYNAEISVDRAGVPFEATSAAKAPLIAGMSGHLWSESVRTDEQFEYMIWPRLAAQAERGWHKGSWEVPFAANTKYNASTTFADKAAMHQDYNEFTNVLSQRELAKLDAMGIHFRVPAPGAKVDATGQLTANTEFPGSPVKIEYAVDSGDRADPTFTAYTGPTSIPMGSKVLLRSSFNGRTSRVETIDMSDCPCVADNNGAGCMRDPNFWTSTYECSADSAPTADSAATAEAPAAEPAAPEAAKAAEPASIDHSIEIYVCGAIIALNVLMIAFISFRGMMLARR